MAACLSRQPRRFLLYRTPVCYRRSTCQDSRCGVFTYRGVSASDLPLYTNCKLSAYRNDPTYLPFCRCDGARTRKQDVEEWRAMGFTGSAKYWTIAATAVCVAAACIYAPFFAKKPEKTLDKMDSTFVEELKALDAKRLYTSYNDGGFVIYHGMQSFVDSRADLFPADAIDASVQMGLAANTSERALQDNIEKYNFDAILLNRSESKTCIEMMDLLPDWQRAIENDSYIVYTPVSK